MPRTTTPKTTKPKDPASMPLVALVSPLCPCNQQPMQFVDQGEEGEGGEA